MLRVYHYPLSPFSRKIRLVLAEKKLEFDLIDEKYWEARTDFLRINPAGKVPVLKFKDVIIPESNAICEYIEELEPEPALLPRMAEARAETRRLVYWFDDKFYHDVTKPLLTERVFKKILRQGYPDSQKVKAATQDLRFHLGYMTWLLEDRRWLAGNQMTLADFSAAGQFSCLDYLGCVDWSLSPAVSQWYAKLKSRPAFRGLLADRIPGFPPPDHYADLDF